MFGWPCHSERNGGTLQTTLSAVAKGLSKALEKEHEGASKVARDRERVKQARDMRIKDPARSRGHRRNWRVKLS